MIARRDLLLWTVSGVSLSVHGRERGRGRPAQPQLRQRRPRLRLRAWSSTARANLAKAAFKAAIGRSSRAVREPQLRAICRDPARSPRPSIWAHDNVGFAIEPLHRGFIFSAPVRLHSGRRRHVRPAQLTAARIRFRQLAAPPPNHAGSAFRASACCRRRRTRRLVEVAIFQGASFLRAIARGQNLGATPAALSIRTARPQGRRVPVHSRGLDRAALARQRRARGSRADRFGKHDRRLPLHLAAGRRDHHRHRMHPVRPRGRSIISASAA